MNILYSKIGQRKWFKTVFANQCKHELFYGRCQGVEGHSGDHWMYSPCGTYQYDHPKEVAKKTGIACGSIPPGHPNYLNPVNKSVEYYLSFKTTTEVTDEGLIYKLENDEDTGDDAIIDRQVE